MPTENERQELAKKSDLLTKQDTLIAGTGISIAADGKTISATGTGGSTVEVTPIQLTGTRIAAMTIDGNIISLYAPTPPTVSATQVVQSGVEVARITINGSTTSIYAPEGTAVLSGTSAPTSQQGEDNDLYVRLDGTTGEVVMTYVKLSGAWVELAASGSEVEPNPQGATTATLSSIGIDGINYEINGLPENYDAQPIFLKITSPDAYNELGWGPGDDTWYYETSCTVQNNYRDYIRPSTSPALGGLVKNTSTGEVTPVFVSTDSTAVTVNSWASPSTVASFEYNGHTWYFNGAYYGCWSAVTNPQNIEYIGEFTSWQASAEWLVEHSVIYFDEYEDTFTQISAPASGYLFAGGGEETDLSDATFKVTSEGVVDAHEYLVDGQPLEAGAVDDVKVNGASVVDNNKVAQIKSYKEVTQAQYNALSSAEKNNGTLYCITDASANGNLEDLGDVSITNPAANDTIKWNPTTLRWENGAGGGGGDANYEELTQDEYDALTTEEKNNGTIYFITDAQGKGSKYFAPVIYSETEREIGVWTDGKPLYEKTVHTGALTKDTNWHGIAHNISNIDKIISCRGIVAANDSANTWYPIPAYRPGYSYGVCLDANSTEIEYIQNWLDASPDSYVILQYTKTTDAPGSGHWTPGGVPAVHYSTDEQIIGTWTDGKTIYQKTLIFTTTSSANTYTQVQHGVTNIDKIWIDTANSFVIASTYTESITPYGVQTSSGTSIFQGLITSNTFDYSVGTTFTSCPAYVTLKYTKSTS